MTDEKLTPEERLLRATKSYADRPGKAADRFPLLSAALGADEVQAMMADSAADDEDDEGSED